MKIFTLPEEINHIANELQKAGFSAYLVGGSVRDLLMKTKPKDWDITTNATPSEIQKIFPKTFYANTYGTVTVVNENTTDPTLKNIEITPFRKEGVYSDKRHPSTVSFHAKLTDDLKRRDFTINAVAYDINKGQIIDPHKGQKDIKDKIIRAVGDPRERFMEDALRLIRAIRFAACLSFTIEEKTAEAIKENAENICAIAIERIRDELNKIILSPYPKKGFEILENLGLLRYIIPELREGIGVRQNQAHSYNVWEHNLRALQHAADKNYSFHVRLAALLHDVAKPKMRQWSKEKNDWTFHGHDIIGAKMTKQILQRLKYPRETIQVVTILVRHHLFFSDVDKITLSAVRRLVKNVGKENIWELMKVRYCDRIGTGRPKETPYRLRKYESMIEEALRSPLSVQMLKIDGKTIMNKTSLRPGPKIGYILYALLEEVLDNPQKNNKEYLEKRAVDLAKLPDAQLELLGLQAKQTKEKRDYEEIKKIRKRHWVK